MSAQPRRQLPAIAPVVTPETELFWSATAEGRLLLPRCTECDTVIWYPKGLCTECGSTDLEWIEASGRGTIYSYSTTWRALGQYAQVVPYVVAYVELEEGPRVITNIVGCEPAAISIGDPVIAVFDITGEGNALVRFRLVSATVE